MNSATSSLPSPRVAPNGRRAFGGVWRLTARRFTAPGQWLPFAGVMALIVLLMLVTARTGRTAVYYHWLDEFYIAFLIPILAFISGASAARDDLRSVSVDYVLVRPVRRPALVVFRFLSHLACVQVGYLIGFAIIVSVGWMRDIPGALTMAPRFVPAEVVSVTVFTAAGFFAGVLTSRYIVLGLIYGWVVEVGLGQIPTQINRLSLTRQLKNAFVVAGRNDVPSVAPHAWATFATLLIVAGVLVAAATALFATREFAGEAAQES